MNLTNVTDIGNLTGAVSGVWNQAAFGNHVKAFLIFFGFLILARVFIFIYERYLLKLVERSKSELDDKLIKGIRKPVFYGLLFLGVYFGVGYIDYPENVGVVVDRVLISFIVLFVAYFALKVVDFIVHNWLKNLVERSDTKLDDVVFPLLHKIVGILFVIVAGIFILNLWSVEVGPLLASLGIAGLAIGFALKDSLANVFGGVSLIVDRTFKVGDYVKIDKETKGRVIDIGLRSTKIKTVDNHVIIVPNGDVSNKKIINYAKLDLGTRIVIGVNVEYGSDVGKVKRVLLDCVDAVDDEILDKDKEARVYFSEMGDFALRFKLVVPIVNYKKRFVNAEKLRVRVYENLRKYRIKVPFPTYSVRRD